MYKFTENDIFFNTVKTYPKYSFMMYNDGLYINNQIKEGNNKTSSSINVFETNNTVSADGNWIIYDKTYSNGNVSLTPITFSQGQATSSISRSFIRKSGDGYNTQYTTAKAPFKLLAASNAINYYRPLSPYYNTSYFLNTFTQAFNKPVPNYLPSGSTSSDLLNPASDVNIIEIPSIFYKEAINPGSVDLQFYFTGSLIGRAQDIKLNGELIQTTGSTTGSVVGIVLYNEGILLISGSDYISSDPFVQDYYIQPTSSGAIAITTRAAWKYFGSYKNIATGYSIASSSFIMNFEGTNTIPTLTMLAHANKNDLNWSNNPSYLQSGSFAKYLAVTSSTKYIENSTLNIKNTVSSSFANYSASFYPQTFINTIGIYNEEGELIAVAKTANPVRKTNEQDYTFKLKIDL